MSTVQTSGRHSTNSLYLSSPLFVLFVLPIESKTQFYSLAVRGHFPICACEESYKSIQIQPKSIAESLYAMDVRVAR